jgi:Integrase core domain/GAG-pre-integrase domain
MTEGRCHRRFGHPAADVLKRMARDKMVDGLHSIEKETLTPCGACLEGKQEQASHPRCSSRAARRCAILHTDLMDPKAEGLADSSYVLTVMDDHSRYAEIMLLSSKADVAEAFISVARRFERQTGELIKAVRFDRGTEFKADLRRWMTWHGIQAQPSPAYTPQSNSRAERLNKTLIQSSTCSL